MISPKFFYDTLASYGIDFYAGVPDSLLKNLCAYITDHADAAHNIIAANEGGAMGLAAGHYLATSQIPVVYMQNSGEGNIINPLASLTDPDVYNIPVMEKVIKERFHGKYPARKSIQTNFAHIGGPDGLHFQADAIAYCG